MEEKGKRLADKLSTKWYNEGEKSTRYFLRLLNRTIPDDFTVLADSDGNETENPEEIEKKIVDFYKKLYEDFEDITEGTNDPSFFNHIQQISEREDSELAAPLTTDELRTTLHECKDSAPGPDGIPYSIIGLLWPVYGNILNEAWAHSVESGILPPSHKLSYLKLIPKVGKDLKQIANWRPITLSNCDHKLITKTLAKRLCEKVANKINESQTAYIKGRNISENIRAMLATLNMANLEEGAEGLLVALDAKKAFDSVSHKYIEECLNSFGCKSFVKIFKLLYNDLNSNIIINGRIVNGFKIKRGVKQGDSLSCILFIMCMEPLLMNITNNPQIEPVHSNALNVDLPKSYSYADDVNPTIKDKEECLQALFNEYERLSNKAGLLLNADKTELLRLSRDNNVKHYNVVYRGEQIILKTSPKVKINGILFQSDYPTMVDENVKAAIKKMEKHFMAWNRRSLSILGKILICKCFGISQIIYMLQCLSIKECHIKSINHVLYKFIWNRHYRAAKAPERIKREILCTDTKLGGFGMLDVADLDKSLKIKMFWRMSYSNHPFLRLVRNKANLNDFFYPSCNVVYDRALEESFAIIRNERDKLWSTNLLNTNVEFIRAIRQTEIKNVISERGRLSLAYYLIRQRGKRLVSDISLEELNSLSFCINPDKLEKLRLASNMNVGGQCSLYLSLLVGKTLKPIAKCTSKQIRQSLKSSEPITSYKIGLELTHRLSRTWNHRISRLTSIKLRSTVLRIAHGDVYTRERLVRFRLSEDNSCPRCGDVETLEHKFVSCPYVNRIWKLVVRITNQNRDQDVTELAMGIHANAEDITLHAEILNRILGLPSEADFVLMPKCLIKASLESLKLKDKNSENKRHYEDLLLKLDSNN
jgi:hypothetical protein